MLDAGVIIWYNDTKASIPGGWAEDGSFVDRIPRHSNTGVGATGGASTHTHATTSHTHTLNDHTHTVTAATFTGAARAQSGSQTTYGTHSHTNSTSSSNGGTTGGNSDVTGAVNSYPEWTKLRAIKSNRANLLPPKGVIAMIGTNTNTALQLCVSGANLNLAGRYIIGTVTDADLRVTGGANTHSHTINHTHTGASHQHTGTTGATQGRNALVHGGSDGTTGWDGNTTGHTHTYTLGATTASVTAFSGSTPTDGSNRPLSTGLPYYQNISSVNQPLQEGMIAKFVGTTLPIGWVLCNGSNGTPNLVTNNFVYASSSSVVATQGASTHTHAAVSHTHASSGHAHSANSASVSITRYQSGQSNAPGATSDNTHVHACSTDSITATHSNANHTTNDANTLPPYIEVKFIMATKAALGGGANIYHHFL